MEKYIVLKKKLIITASIFAVIIIVFSGIWYFLSTKEESSGQDFKNMQRETRQASSKIDSIEVKYELARNSIDHYGTLNKKLLNGDLSISKEKLYNLLRKLNVLHRISNLKLEIDNISAKKPDGASTDEPLETEFTNIKVQFDALSDLHAIAFLQGVDKYLHGYLGMDLLQISRERQITRAVLQAFANGEKPRVISTSVNYVWFGIKQPSPIISEAPNEK